VSTVRRAGMGLRRVARGLPSKDTREGSRIANYSRAGGPHFGGKDIGDKLLRRLSDALKPVREAASKNRLVQVTCRNCGHTELLDASRLDPPGPEMVWR